MCRMKWFLIMFDECRFSVKRKEAFKTFVNRNLANIGNKISWHTKIYLTFSFVEFRTLNQVHKNMVLLVFDAYKSLNYGRIVNRCQLINFFSLVLQFSKSIKLPICFRFFHLANLRNIGFLSNVTWGLKGVRSMTAHVDGLLLCWYFIMSCQEPQPIEKTDAEVTN